MRQQYSDNGLVDLYLRTADITNLWPVFLGPDRQARLLQKDELVECDGEHGDVGKGLFVLTHPINITTRDAAIAHLERMAVGA